MQKRGILILPLVQHLKHLLPRITVVSLQEMRQNIFFLRHPKNIRNFLTLRLFCNDLNNLKHEREGLELAGSMGGVGNEMMAENN